MTDIIAPAGAWELLRESQRLLRATIDSLTSHIAILDETGRLLEVNAAWRRFAEGDRPGSTILGANYLAYCESGAGAAREGPGAAAGIREVLAGRTPLFTTEFACPGPAGPRWFRMRVTRLASPGPPRAVVEHEDITAETVAAEQLRDSEARFRRLADALPQIVWMARPDGHTDYFNRRWYEFTGFPEGEGAGAGWTPVLHPDDVGRCLELWYAAVRSGRPYEIEYRFKDRATGGYRWFLTRALPVRDAAGNVVRWFGTCTDIHDQKQAEEAQRFLAEASAAFVGSLDDRAVLQRVAELAVPALADFCFFDVVADDGAITRVGWHHGDPAKRERFEGFLRFVPTQQSEGHPVPAAIASGRPVLVPEVTDAWVRSLAPGPEHLRLLRDLRLRSLMTVPLCIGEQRLGALTFCYGESGRRHTRLELYLAEELARRAALTVQNARLYARLREADRRKDEFLAVLAHELRNPLAAMRNATEVARLLPAGDAQWRWAHGVIDRQSARLARLVDDLLDVSRITRGKIPLRLAALDLGAVAAEAVETVRPLVEARRHELRVDLPPRPVRVLGDPARIEQVLANLLHNAAKYTEVGGRITLAVRPDGPDAVVSVADTGIGVPPEMLPRLFDMFAQVEGSVERSQGGLGIGLTLVKRLVEMHGGTVAAASDGPGTGSEFTVRLPALPEAAPAPVPAGPPPVARRARARRRVLVIDDNIDCADSLAVLLRLWGHEVEVSHDGMAGLEAVPAFAPDVVLLDIGLPKMDGLQVARGLRGRPDLPPVLLVAMTGYGQEDDRRRTREAGFDHHLVKPIDPEVLQALLDGAAP